MNPTIWKMSGPFDPKIKAALPDCDRQSGDRSGIMLSRQFPTSILTDTGIIYQEMIVPRTWSGRAAGRGVRTEQAGGRSKTAVGIDPGGNYAMVICI